MTPAERDRAVRYYNDLLHFVSEILDGVADGHDYDGSDIQDLAVKHGLLVRVPYDPEKHTLPDWLEGEVEPGDNYFERTDAIKEIDNLK